MSFRKLSLIKITKRAEISHTLALKSKFRNIWYPGEICYRIVLLLAQSTNFYSNWHTWAAINQGLPAQPDFTAAPFTKWYTYVYILIFILIWDSWVITRRHLTYQKPQEGGRHVTHPNCALYEIQSVVQETCNGAVNGVSYRVISFISLHINTLSVSRQ